MGTFVLSFMKKLIVSILAFLYITSSCEATVYLHYCMGKQVSFSFLPEDSKNCHRCGMKKSDKGMGCCKDEQKIIKSDKNQKLTDLVYSNKLQKKFITVHTSFRAFAVATERLCIISNSSAHSPPGIQGSHRFILNRALLI
ncbi:MAG TPA: hypothetical protein VK711_03580 [Puia sp.]|nr:hypothetical protein [Puia sp.]